MTEMGYVAKFSNILVMFEMMKTNNNIGEDAQLTPALEKMNRKLCIMMSAMIANMLVSNLSCLPAQPPGTCYKKPDCDLDARADQLLTHLHEGILSESHKELRRQFRGTARSDICKIHYMSYKRNHTRMYYFVLDLSEKWSCWDSVYFDMLVGEDSSKHRMVSWNSWEETLLKFVTKIYKHGVYDDLVLWFKRTAKKGVLVNVFAIWWGLIGAPHVSTLPLAKRKDFRSPTIFL